MTLRLWHAVMVHHQPVDLLDPFWGLRRGQKSLRTAALDRIGNVDYKVVVVGGVHCDLAPANTGDAAVVVCVGRNYPTVELVVECILQVDSPATDRGKTPITISVRHFRPGRSLAAVPVLVRMDSN